MYILENYLINDLKIYFPHFRIRAVEKKCKNLSNSPLNHLELGLTFFQHVCGFCDQLAVLIGTAFLR